MASPLSIPISLWPGYGDPTPTILRTWRPWLGSAVWKTPYPKRLCMESLPLLEPETDPKRILFPGFMVFSGPLSLARARNDSSEHSIPTLRVSQSNSTCLCSRKMSSGFVGKGRTAQFDSFFAIWKISVSIGLCLFIMFQGNTRSRMRDKCAVREGIRGQCAGRGENARSMCGVRGGCEVNVRCEGECAINVRKGERVKAGNAT